MIEEVEDADLKELWEDVRSQPTPEQMEKLRNSNLNTKLQKFWKNVRSQPTPEQIEKLENFLLHTKLSVTLGRVFEKDLNRLEQSGNTPGAPKKTVLGATGTPFKKNQ